MHSKQSSNPLTKEMNYESCKHAKAAADKIESGVILNNSQQDFRAFKVAPNHHTTYLMNSARPDYFSNVIVKTSSNQRKLFLTTSSLLFEPTDVSFPCQITYLPIIWLIILATILYRRLNVSMTHWTPFSNLSLLTAMMMRPQQAVLHTVRRASWGKNQKRLICI